MSEVNLKFKALEPYRELIDDVSDERRTQEGVWVYLKEPSSQAASFCAPQTLHEDSVAAIVSQLRAVRAAKREGRT